MGQVWLFWPQPHPFLPADPSHQVLLAPPLPHYCFFWDRISLYSSGWPGVQYIDRASFEFRDSPTSASVPGVLGVKGVCHCCPSWQHFKNLPLLTLFLGQDIPGPRHTNSMTSLCVLCSALHLYSQFLAPLSVFMHTPPTHTHVCRST